MKKHKLYSLAMTGALSFGILGTSFPAMAAPIQTTASESGGGALDEETKDKAQTIMDELKAQLADLGVEMPERGGKMDKFAGLDEETKAKVQTIMEEQKSGNITAEEAQTQLAELGIEMPKHEPKMDILSGLDKETKEKAQKLIDEAQTKLAELGVDHLPFKHLTDEK